MARHRCSCAIQHPPTVTARTSLPRCSPPVWEEYVMFTIFRSSSSLHRPHRTLLRVRACCLSGCPSSRLLRPALSPPYDFSLLPYGDCLLPRFATSQDSLKTTLTRSRSAHLHVVLLPLLTVSHEAAALLVLSSLFLHTLSHTLFPAAPSLPHRALQDLGQRLPQGALRRLRCQHALAQGDPERRPWSARRPPDA